MNIAYVAYTEGNVLMLDGEGVCVRVEPLRGRLTLGALAGRFRWADAPPASESRRGDTPTGLGPDPSDGALRCIGAQYVASIDPSEPGGLARLPRVGTSMLFAAVDKDGRIFCVRAGPLTHFESCTADESGSHRAAPNDTQRRDTLPWEEPATLLRETPARAPHSGYVGGRPQTPGYVGGGPQTPGYVGGGPQTPGYRGGPPGPEPESFDEKTDPGFSVSLPGGGYDDIEDEPRTAPYPSTRYTYGHQSSRSTPVPAPPPPPRLPRIQALVPPHPHTQRANGGNTPHPLPLLPSRRVARQNGTRAVPSAPHAGSNARPTPPARPPAPSSHAWLRSSPAAERRWR